MGLVAGDRLRPSPQLVDIGELSAVQTPVVVRFWRPRWYRQVCMDSLNYRNPLFSPCVYITPFLTFVMDILRIVHLGVHSKIIAMVPWALIELNPYGVSGGHETVEAVTLERLSERLREWYNVQGVPRNYRLSGVARKMIGTASLPQMKTMASETNALLPWVLTLCRQCQRQFPNGKPLMEAVGTVQKW
eukprot:8021164-Pyramimonas_sp.AAC.1